MQFFKSIATLFPRFAPRPGALERAVKTSPKTRRLRLEPLENRELLAVDAFAAAFGPPSLENVANEASPAVVSASVLADDRATLSVRTETPTPVVVPSFEQLMESLGMVEIESLDALAADADAEKSPESNATQTELQPSFIVDGVAYYPLSQATPRRVVFEGSDVDVASLDEPFVIVPNANADGESVYGAQSGGSGGEGEPDVWTLDFTGEVTTLLGGLTAVGIENALLERATTVSGGASFGSGGASGGAASGGGNVEIESLAPNYLQVTLPELPYAYEATVTFGGEALLGVDYEIHAPLPIFNQYYNAQSFVYSGGSTDFYVLPVNDGAPEPLENFTATLATPTPTVDSGGTSYAQPYEFTFATSETVSATFVDDDHWQVSVEASDPTATERLADVEQDYGYYTFKREHQNPYVAEKIDAKVQELTEANATEAAIGAVQALAALVTGDTTYGVTVDFEALYNRESTYDAQPTVDYALSTSPLASESASSYLSSFTFSSTPNQSEDPLWRYDCSGVIPQWRTEALLRLNPTFDWLDEGELFDPNYLIDADLDAATPDEQLGEKARLRLLDATWSGQGAEYDPLAETLAEVEIKDGALAELYFDYDGDGTLDPYQSTDDETCYVPLNNDDDNENDVEDRLETALVANENDVISALAVAWLDTLTCLTDGVYYVIDAFLNFAGTAISVFEDPDGTDPYEPTDANGNQTPIFVSSPTSPTYAAPVYLEGTDFGAAGATLDPDVSRVTEGDATSNDDDIKTPTNLGPVVDKPIMSTPYKVDIDVDSDNNGYITPYDDDLEDVNGRSIVYFPSEITPPIDYKEVDINLNWSELDGNLTDYRIGISTPTGIIIRSRSNPELTFPSNESNETPTFSPSETVHTFYAVANAPNASSLAPVRVTLEKKDDAGNWIPVASDTIAFNIQNSNDASDWIVPSGWRIGEDGSLTTYAIQNGAFGPVTPGSSIITNEGCAYSRQAFAEGFTLSFNYEFLHNEDYFGVNKPGNYGYVQGDTNKDYDIDNSIDEKKLSFVGNSGVKIGGASGVTEVAILDFCAMVDMVGNGDKDLGIAEIAKSLVEHRGTSIGNSTGNTLFYKEEELFKLLHGVIYNDDFDDALSNNFAKPITPSSSDTNYNELLNDAFKSNNKAKYITFLDEYYKLCSNSNGMIITFESGQLTVRLKQKSGLSDVLVYQANGIDVKDKQLYLQTHHGSGVRFSNVQLTLN